MLRKIVMFSFFFVSVMLFISNVSFARGGFGRHNCDCYEKDFSAPKTAEFKKFREETLSLRQLMAEKRFELEKESLSDNPDKAKIEKLTQEIKNLREKVHDIRTKYGISAKRFSPRCY